MRKDLQTYALTLTSHQSFSITWHFKASLPPPPPPSPLQLPPISITNFFCDFDCSIFLSQTQSEIQETSDHGRISPILNISASAKNRQLQKVMLFRLFGFGSHALQNKIDARCFILWTHLNMFFLPYLKCVKQAGSVLVTKTIVR